MRHARQSKILELIRTQGIDTQDKLAEKLRAAGFNVTQATISRDIKEMGLIKVPGKNGKSVYAQAPRTNSGENDRYRKILKETVREIRPAENILVIRTLSGCANAAAEAIDTIAPESVVGTLAGDNTIFVAVDTKENVAAVLKVLQDTVS